MRVLVTGASGFVGAHSAQALQADGHELRLLVRDRAKLDRVAVATGVVPDDVVLGDITDADAVRRALAGCDAVLHTAGAVSLSRRDAAETLRVNASGACAVLVTAAEAGLGPLVHVSSTSALQVDPTRPLAADADLTRAGGYAGAKAAAEQVARDLQAAGAPVHVTYPAGVIGPAAGESLGETSASMAAFVAGGVMPTRRAALSLIDVRDLALVHTRLFVPGEHPARIMGGGHCLTLPELAGHLRRLTGRRYPSPPVPPGLLRLAGRLLDGLARVLPIDPTMTEEAMTLVTRWPGTDDDLAALGVTPRPVEETLAVALQAWLAAGLIRPRHIGPRAAGTSPASPGPRSPSP